jgi:hypothetical protein
VKVNCGLYKFVGEKRERNQKSRYTSSLSWAKWLTFSRASDEFDCNKEAVRNEAFGDRQSAYTAGFNCTTTKSNQNRYFDSAENSARVNSTAMANRRSLRARPTSVGNDGAQQHNKERDPKRRRLHHSSSDLPVLEDGSPICLPFRSKAPAGSPKFGYSKSCDQPGLLLL